MPLLLVQLLGGFEVRGVDGRDVTPASRKACGLLACLALPPGIAWSRDRLAAVFWSDRGEAQARGSVRQALTDLRHTLGPAASLQIARDTVMLDPAAATVDAIDFEQAVRAGDLERAAMLYRGDLLDGFTLHSSGFHDWLLVERTRLRDLAVDALTRLTASQSGAAAIQSCQRLLQIDPTREEAHRLLMNLYARQDQRALALRQFQICRDILQRELDTKPDPETEALFLQLQKPMSHSMRPLSIDLDFPSPPSEMPSIVVLPFANMSGDPEQEYFSDGITENIITSLSRFRDLFIIARNSSFAYKSKVAKIQDVCRELGVRYVLEGSVQRSGDRVRVTAQLIDGGSGGHLWAERYDQQLVDIFAVQDDVTERIVGTLATAYGGRLHKAWQGRAKEIPGRSFQALDYFMRGMEAFDRFSKDDVRDSGHLFQKAIELDPNYSKALAKIAWVHIIEALDEFSDNVSESWTCAQKFAAMAIERDDEEAWGHWAMAAWYLYRAQQHDHAITELTRALELNPNDADVMTDYAFHLSYAGQAEKAIEWAQKAMRLNPSYPQLVLDAARANLLQRSSV